MMIGDPIWSDPSALYTPAFDGTRGLWSVTLPLVNLQNSDLSLVARSSDAATTSTVLTIDLGVARSIQAIGIIGHNFSLAATVRVRGDDNSDLSSPVYDSTALAAYDAALTAENIAGRRMDYILFPSAAQTSRYWGIDISDATNPAGYVQFARLVIASGFQPTINMQYGAAIGYEDLSSTTSTPTGAAKHAVRPKRRRLKCAINDLPESEALTNLFEMQRRLGTTGQLLVGWALDDTTHKHRRAFLARNSELSLMEMASMARYGTPLSLIEEL